MSTSGKRVMVVGLLGLVYCAAVGAGIAYHLNRPPASPPEPPVKVSVFLAKRAFSWGDEITSESQFVRLECDKAEVPERFVSNWAALQGKRVYQNLSEGQAITEGHIRSDLFDHPGPGYKALAARVRSDLVTRQIKPGAHVDLLCSYDREGMQAVATFMQNSKVLATKEADDGFTDLILAGKQHQAQAIAWARRKGATLSAVLRRPGDTTVAEVGKTTDEDFFQDGVLVANEDLPAETKLADPDKQFKRVLYSKGHVPFGAITHIAKLRDRVLQRAAAADQPIKEKDLAPADEK